MIIKLISNLKRNNTNNNIIINKLIYIIKKILTQKEMKI